MPEPTATYGLIGHPLGHSFSRRYFSEKFEKEDINARYLNFDIENIDAVRDIINHTDNLIGFNVTIPYKRLIIPFLDSISPEAAEIGAVNVVKILHENGRKVLAGYNTDISGFMESIRPHLNRSHRNALILGTGGASMAIKVGLDKLGIPSEFVSRNPKRGQYSYSSLTESIMACHTVIINCTPLGTFPAVDTFAPIPYQYITPEHLCYDLVYNPPVTKFLELSSRQGAETVNGSLMLKIQADRAWEIWNSNGIKI